MLLGAWPGQHMRWELQSLGGHRARLESFHGTGQMGGKQQEEKKWLCEGERCELAVRKGKITQMMLGMAGQRGAGSTNRCTYGVKRGRKMEKCPQNPQPHTSLGTLSAPFLSQSLSLKPVLKPNVRSSSASCFFARALPDSSRNLHRCKTASSEKG